MRSTENRLRVISLAVFATALVLAGKLYFVKIVSGEEFTAKAEGQYIAGANYFDRGSIYFTTKDGDLVPAASIASGSVLYINPRVLRVSSDLTSVFEQINAIIPIGREDFFNKAATDSAYRELAKHLTIETAEKIRLLKIPGVAVAKQRR